MRKWLVIVFLATATYAGAQTIPCASGFSTVLTAPCGVGFPGSGTPRTFLSPGNAGQNISGTTLILQPAGAVHDGVSVLYQTALNDQAWTTTYTWTPNGWNLAFMLENVSNQSGGNGGAYAGGGGCEGGFFQGFASAVPNNVFAINFDSNAYISTASGFTYSTVQLFQTSLSPCLPADGTEDFYSTLNRISTSPVPLTSPASTKNSYTSDTYSTTITYTGTTVTAAMYDVTAGGTCTPITSGTCFTYTWDNVSVPALVGATTAWVGFAATTNAASAQNLSLYGFTYNILSAAATPTFSPVAGTYAGTQTVTISSSSSGSVICYNTTGAPATNGFGGCANGTLYSGAVSVAAGETLYAVAGNGTTAYGDSAVASAAYQIGSTAAAPTFSQGAGIWEGTQTIYLSTARGGVICYNTTGSPATNGSTGCTTGTHYTGAITVSSSETLYAVAGGTGFGSDSAVSSAAYTISPYYPATSNGGTYNPANSPTFSPAPGTYSGAQSVTLATTTSGGNICYVVSATPPSVPPAPNQAGGCSSGTAYSSAISVPSTSTIYAVAGQTVGACCSNSGPPSSISQASYNIASGATAPSCTPTSGSSGSSITVTCTNSNSGTTIMCYTENGATPATNGSGTGCTTGTSLSGSSNTITINSTVPTLNVIAGTSTLSDSTVSSYGPYTISATTALTRIF